MPSSLSTRPPKAMLGQLPSMESVPLSKVHTRAPVRSTLSAAVVPRYGSSEALHATKAPSIWATALNTPLNVLPEGGAGTYLHVVESGPLTHPPLAPVRAASWLYVSHPSVSHAGTLPPVPPASPPLPPPVPGMVVVAPVPVVPPVPETAPLPIVFPVVPPVCPHA